MYIKASSFFLLLSVKPVKQTCVYDIHFAGVTVSNSTFNSLVQRYSYRDGKIYFDGYIHCIARLCTMFGTQLPCPKISAFCFKHTLNLVFSSWILTKYRTPHYLNITYIYGDAHYDVRI